MTPQILIDECRKSGVTIHLDCGALKLRGASEAVRSMAARMRPHKTELLAHLVAANDGAEIAGPFTPYVCGISPELVHELHALIAVYAKQFKYTEAETQRIIETAKRQALSTVPSSVEFFKRAIQRTT